MCLSTLKSCIESSESIKIYVDSIKYNYCNLSCNEFGKRDIYLNRNISGHLDKLGFKETRGRDKKASYFAVNSSIFNEIVSPICPNLTILSTSSPSSTPLYIKDNKKSGDGVVIDGDDVDTWENSDIKKNHLRPINPKEVKKLLNDESYEIKRTTKNYVRDFYVLGLELKKLSTLSRLSTNSQEVSTWKITEKNVDKMDNRDKDKKIPFLPCFLE